MEGKGLEGDGSNREALGKCLSGFVDDGSTESHRYYLSRRTVLEMLRDRGYAVPNSEINLSLQEFRAIYGQSPDFDRFRLSVTHKTDSSKRMLVVFYGPGTVKVSGIRLIAGLITNKESLTGLILVLQNHITNQALKALDLFSFKVEIFQLPRLLKKDAIARYYGFEKGQVVKVTYGGEITESHVTYRCVW
ncbi:DNA-directed RNA polymerase V subunit 5A-like isoform X2 [Durio zibethinus]|uniref:DNA-directed RNA polymerase V subunit 5A-like isoform X2 n=1 Tax=Durio zibethinus TaxID=66656 RepID=A0A6P5YW75_DURZI|nr:DNA-directed RNA polymerase V subunit 5A-like isoform X2 [Durio zibethinus]